MPYLLNLVYLLVLVLLAPWLVYKAITTGKLRRGFWTKLTGRVTPALAGGARLNGITVWFHGVSVGEIHLLRQVIARYRQRHPEHRCVVSTTTDTGYDEACKAFPDLPVIFWPFDFTWAVKTALSRVNPDLVVLAEGEIWPNFVRIARGRGIRLAVVNGRMSPRTAKRYARLSWLTQGILRRLDVVAAQTEEYAAGFRQAGARNAIVTGSVKYDGACLERGNPKTLALRELFNIAAHELVWVAGSTQDPEEEIVLAIYRTALVRYPNLRLILVPRQKDRFEPVAELLAKSNLPYVRRSAMAGPLTGAARPVILIDTFGELSAAWGLADVAFVGGSLDGQRGGQNMIEPAGYGAAVVFGPHTWNFKDTVARLLERTGALQVNDAAELERTVLDLLADPTHRHELGDRARRFVRSQQGATDRTLDALDLLSADNRARLAS